MQCGLNFASAFERNVQSHANRGHCTLQDAEFANSPRVERRAWTCCTSATMGCGGIGHPCFVDQTIDKSHGHRWRFELCWILFWWWCIQSNCQSVFWTWIGGNGLWHNQILVIFMPCVLHFVNCYSDSLKDTIVVFRGPMVSVCGLRKRDSWPHQCDWAGVSSTSNSCVTCWRLVPPSHGLHFLCLGQFFNSWQKHSSSRGLARGSTAICGNRNLFGSPVVHPGIAGLGHGSNVATWTTGQFCDDMYS